MKKLLLFVTVLSFVTTFAQDKKSLEQRAQKMVEVTYNLQYDAILDHTYPKVFDIVPRDVLREALENMFKTEEFTVKLINVAPNFKFGEIKKIDNSFYSLVDHDLAMEMKFNEPIEDEGLYIDALKAGLDTEEVAFNKTTNTISVKKRAQMVAINDEVSKNLWTFINNDNGPLMNQLLSEKVIKELGL